MADSANRAYRDNPEVSHETSDVNVKGILRFAAALTIAAAVIHVALYGLLLYYDQRETRRLVPLSSPRQEEAPPEPRLRVAPRADLLEMRNAEERVLQSYGWIDRGKNVVRMPIERSMEAIVKRGLPARKPTPQKSNETGGNPTTPAGEPFR